MARITQEMKKAVETKIIEVATASFLKNGYKQTSTKHIASTAGIAEGTLFNYYKTKAALLVAVLEKQTFVDSYVPTDETPLLQCMMLSKASADYLLKLPKTLISELLQVILNKPIDGQSLQAMIALDFKFIDKISDLLTELQGAAKLRTVDSKLLAESLYADMVFCMFLYIYDPHMTSVTFYSHLERKYDFTLKPYIGVCDVD